MDVLRPLGQQALPAGSGLVIEPIVERCQCLPPRMAHAIGRGRAGLRGLEERQNGHVAHLRGLRLDPGVIRRDGQGLLQGGQAFAGVVELCLHAAFAGEQPGMPGAGLQRGFIGLQGLGMAPEGEQGIAQLPGRFGMGGLTGPYRLLEVLLKFRYGDQMADRLKVKVEDTGLDADALLRMPSEERRALTELLAKYKSSRRDEEDDDE